MQGAKSKVAAGLHYFGAPPRLERAFSGNDLQHQGASAAPVHNENDVFFPLPDIEEDGTHARWADEVVKKWGQATARLAARSRVVQFVVAATVLVDVVISVYTVIDDSVNDDVSLRILSVVILIVLTLDIIIRLVAHRLAFFSGGINVLELVIVILCLIELLFRSLFPINSSIGRLFRPVARGLKIASSTLKVLGVRRRVNMRVDQIADTISDDLLEKALGDVIYISPENATAQPTEGRFLIEKTHFLPGAFKDIHAPVTIKGGFIELIYVDADLKTPTWTPKVPWGSRGTQQLGGSHADLGKVPEEGGIRRRATKHMTKVLDKVQARKHENAKKHGSGVIVVCKNILLVVGPGHYGDGTVCKSWQFDEVVFQKDRLVELFAARVEMLLGKKKKKEPVEAAPPPRRPPQQAGVMGAMGKVRDAMFSGAGAFANIKHVSVDILNVEVRYEDFDLLPRPDAHHDNPQASLMSSFLGRSQPGGCSVRSHVPISLGAKIGQFHMRLEGGPTSPLDHPLFRARAAWHQKAPVVDLEKEPTEKSEHGANAASLSTSRSPPKSPPTSARGMMLHAGKSSSAMSLGNSSEERPPIRVAIRLVRVSSWLDHDVQQSSCFTPFFSSPDIKLQGAVRLFRRSQCLERLKLAAISAVEQTAAQQEAMAEADESAGRSRIPTATSAAVSSLPTSNTGGTMGTQGTQAKKVKLRMQRFREMVMPHYYILSPAVVSVHMLTLEPPEPEEKGQKEPQKKALMRNGSANMRNAGRMVTPDPGQGHRPGHAIDVEVPKLNFQLDPWQVHALLLFQNYVVQWIKHDSALSRRPILRPGEVPRIHASAGDGEQAVAWQDEVEHHRKQVIRSWWVYAAHQIAFSIAPNGKLETFLELRRRARCRGVYIASLMTKLRSEHLHKMTFTRLGQRTRPSIFGGGDDRGGTASTGTNKAVTKNIAALRGSLAPDEIAEAPAQKDSPDSPQGLSKGASGVHAVRRKLDSSATSVDLIRLMDAAEKRPQDFIWNETTEYALREMQVTLPFQDILLARVVAKQRHEEEKRGGPHPTEAASKSDLLTSSQSAVVQVEDASETERPPPKAETSQITLRIVNITTAFLDPPSGDKEVKLRRQQVRAFVNSISLVFTQGSPASEWPRLTQRPVGVVNRGQFGNQHSDEAVFKALHGQSSPPITDSTAATSGWIGVELAVGAFGVLYVQAPQEVPSLRVVLQQLPAKKRKEASPRMRADPSGSSLTSIEPLQARLETTPAPANPIHDCDRADRVAIGSEAAGSPPAPMVVVRLVSWREDHDFDAGDTPRKDAIPGEDIGGDVAFAEDDGSAAPRLNAPPKVRQNVLFVFVCPLEAISYKPLVSMLSRSFKLPATIVPEDNLDLAGAKRDLQQRRAVRKGIQNMSRAFEKATGFKLGSSPDNNGGVRFVISNGSIRATTVEQFTRERLLIQRVDLPATTQAFSSNEIPPFFEGGMRLQTATSDQFAPPGTPITASFHQVRPVEVTSIQVAVEDECMDVDPLSAPPEPFGAAPSTSLDGMSKSVKDSPLRWMSSIFATGCAKLPASCAEVACSQVGKDGNQSRNLSKEDSEAARTSPSMVEIPLQVVPHNPRFVPWIDSRAVSVRIKSAKFATLERELLRLTQLPGLEPQFLQHPPNDGVPVEPDSYFDV